MSDESVTGRRPRRSEVVDDAETVHEPGNDDAETVHNTEYDDAEAVQNPENDDPEIDVTPAVRPVRSRTFSPPSR